MLAIARAYPSSQVCRDALTEAADIYEKNADPRHALMVLRQLLISFPNPPNW